MNFLDKILPENVIYSLGWTIIHSFWQGAVIALLLFAFVTLVKSSSALKAKISLLALGLMIVSFLLTFSIEMSYNEKVNLTVLRTDILQINSAERIPGSEVI